MKLRYSIFLIGLLGFSNVLLAQIPTVSVSAQIDSAVLKIGDQTALTFKVGQNADATVQFPFIEEKIIDLIEVIERNTPDTVDLGQNRIEITQKYTITSFQDSLYYIPPFPFVNNGDTIWSPSLSLGVVQPFEIDTTQNAITDIKDIYDAPIYWARIFRIILYILLAVALGVLIYFLIKRYKAKAKNETKAEEIMLRPAHEVALEELNRIKQEKIWQQHGRQKNFHTELTDTLRQYIDRTYEIGSMEMTTDEILQMLKVEFHDNKACLAALRQLLTLADLVKFAKWNATPDEHEQSLNNAFRFVKETMPKEEEILTEEKTIDNPTTQQ